MLYLQVGNSSQEGVAKINMFHVQGRVDAGSVAAECFEYIKFCQQAKESRVSRAARKASTSAGVQSLKVPLA